MCATNFFLEVVTFPNRQINTYKPYIGKVRGLINVIINVSLLHVFRCILRVNSCPYFFCCVCNTHVWSNIPERYISYNLQHTNNATPCICPDNNSQQYKLFVYDTPWSVNCITCIRFCIGCLRFVGVVQTNPHTVYWGKVHALRYR